MKAKGGTGRNRQGQEAGNRPILIILQWLMQREVWGLLLTVLGLIAILSLFSSGQGNLSRALSLMLRQMFGIGAYLIALFLLVSGLTLLFWNLLQAYMTPRWQTVVGIELVFFAGLGVIHLVSQQDPLQLAQSGSHGGYIGWLWWQLLVPRLGRVVSTLLLVVLLFLGLGLVLGRSRHVLLQRLRPIGERVLWWLRDLWETIRQTILLKPTDAQVQTEPGFLRRQEVPSGEAQPRAAPGELPEVAASPSPTPVRRAPRSTRIPVSVSAPSVGLPQLDLLAADDSPKGDDADARLRAQTIEDTLEAFGIPVEVVDWHRGPVVTQFDVEPGYVERQDRDGVMRRFKIRVSKILSLSNDLSLALAASPIRIEAPVPGRSVVGIEVPNDTKTVVGLRGILESQAFRKARSPLRIALGRDVSGAPIVADLASMPHLLIAGATGSGKSVCLNAIIASLLFFNLPEHLQFLLFDPKRVELTKYNGIPHLVAPVVMDIEKAVAALRWVIREMEGRYEQFAAAGARNIVSYNRMARSKGLEVMPRVLVIIDELADMMLVAPEDVERTLCRLAQMARATGIHLIIATQRPSVDVVTGLIKANFPARISFAVTSLVDSRVILDTPGAEKLLGRGDMLYMAPDSPKLQRIQGCFVSDHEIDNLVAFWRRAVPQHADQDEQPAPWEEMPQEDDSDDSLIQDAIDLVQQHQQASASFLQRHLRIGYPRAARLIDQLERMGVVGPPETAGRSRVVLNGFQSSSEDNGTDLGTEDS